MACVAAALVAVAIALSSSAASAQPGRDKVLRVAFPVAETGFDPQAAGDAYSNYVNRVIFDTLYRYDYLERPYRIVPNTAAGMPQISADGRTWTIHLRKGIYFADDPAFKGRKRELVAGDYVYQWKRFFDPAIKAPLYSSFNEAGVLGVAALREEAIRNKTKFDYDREVEGIRALDRYTLQFKLDKPRPRFIYTLAEGNVFGGVAREVVEFYGDKIMEHPVGTGPFMLSEWRRSSKIVLARNPNYREATYDEGNHVDDPRSKAIAAQLKGRRLPMLDRVEIVIIEESQPRWLSFLNRQTDLMERLPNEFSTVAIPNNVLAPNLAKQGIQMDRAPLADVTLASLFNIENPVVGGYTPEKVALRRAIALAYDSELEIRVARKSQAVPAQTAIAPSTFGYDPNLKTAMSDHDPVRARALLDMYGYLDRDGDGWRERPDGSPLLLRLATTASQTDRRLNELWRRCMADVGLRMRFEIATWGDLLKRSRSASLMMWGYTWVAGTPDGGFFLGIAYGPNANESNDSRFALPAFDRLFERQNVLPDGPERDALMREGKNLLVAHMPYKVRVHTIVNDVLQPWVRGYWRHPFMRDTWVYAGVDEEMRR